MYDSYRKDHTVATDTAHSFQGFPIISDQISKEGLAVVYRELEKTLQRETAGDIVEFGCYIGTTSLFIRRLLDSQKQSLERHFHVYDSFAGLPEKSSADLSPAGTAFTAGKLYVSKKELLQQFHSANLQAPIIHKGWFHELEDTDIPKHIAFAFLDGDFYDSIMDSLTLIWPHLTAHATIVIDDYQREALPGVDRAIQDFFANKAIHRLHGEHQKAIIEL